MGPAARRPPSSRFPPHLAPAPRPAAVRMGWVLPPRDQGSAAPATGVSGEAGRRVREGWHRTFRAETWSAPRCPRCGTACTPRACGSSLSYDAQTQEYTCVWKSERAWAGTYREFTFKLTDGTDRALRFRFTSRPAAETPRSSSWSQPVPIFRCNDVRVSQGAQITVRGKARMRPAPHSAEASTRRIDESHNFPPHGRLAFLPRGWLICRRGGG
jgi:hypothetical protein